MGHQPNQIFQPLAGDDPTTIAGYRLAAKLGAGGMGKVYLSYTPGGRPVAIKVIRPEFGEDPEFRRRFTQEVKSAQRVQGLFTAPVIDADTEGPHPWLATAYVPGPSLADAVAAHGPMPVDTVLLLVAGMAEALQVIHGAGLVHRDLKPSNVLLAADGPRVIDFGIAYAADATSLTGSGVTIGTPSFMAPEQAAGRRVTPATDVFALGQVAAFAAMGNPAFGEGTSHGVLYRIVHEEPDLTGLPERLTELVTRCMAKDVDARPSISEIIALCQAANGETVLRRPEDWLPSPVTADITTRAAAPAPVQTPPPPSAGYTPTAPVAPGYTPTAPVGAAPAAPAPAPAPGHVPPAAHQPPGPPRPYPTPAQMQAQAHAYAPTQLPPPQGPHPGAPRPGGPFPGRPMPPAPQPPKGRGGRAGLAIAAVLVFGLAGSCTAWALLKDNDDPQAKNGGSSQSAQSSDEGQTSGQQSGNDPQSTDPKPTDPEPASYPGINLPAGYHLTLSEDDVRPKQGEDADYELSYDTGGYLDAEMMEGNLVLLDPGQQGSLAVCRQDTRYTKKIYLDKISKGRQVCINTGNGHMGLITIQGFSPEDSTSKYLTLDLTVWRNAAATE